MADPNGGGGNSPAASASRSPRRIPGLDTNPSLPEGSDGGNSLAASGRRLPPRTLGPLDLGINETPSDGRGNLLHEVQEYNTGGEASAVVVPEPNGGNSLAASGRRLPPRTLGALDLGINETLSDVRGNLLHQVQEYNTGGEESAVVVHEPNGRNYGELNAQPSQAYFPNQLADSAITKMLSGSGPIKVELWKNVFSINGGPVKEYDDPESADFIKYIENGKFDTAHVNIKRHHQNYLGAFDAGSKETEPILAQEATTRSVHEGALLFLLDNKDWTSAESTISSVLNGPNQWRVHPVIFLELRRRAFMDFIEAQDFTGASRYFETCILEPFNQIIEAGQAQMQYASLNYIKDEFTTCQNSLVKHYRPEHPHDSNEKLAEFIFDYIQLHVPTKIGLPITKGIWRFAKEIPRKNPTAIKKSYRCLACSNYDTHNLSIGKLKLHLVECNPWMDSPFLSSLFGVIMGSDASKAADASPLRSNSSQALHVPTSKECHELFLKKLGQAKAYDVMTRKYIPADYHGQLDLLLESMKSYASAAIHAGDLSVTHSGSKRKSSISRSVSSTSGSKRKLPTTALSDSSRSGQPSGTHELVLHPSTISSSQANSSAATSSSVAGSVLRHDSSMNASGQRNEMVDPTSSEEEKDDATKLHLS